MTFAAEVSNGTPSPTRPSVAIAVIGSFAIVGRRWGRSDSLRPVHARRRHISSANCSNLRQSSAACLRSVQAQNSPAAGGLPGVYSTAKPR